MKFFVTFGSGQYGGTLANSYIEIEAPSESHARLVTASAFGAVWAFLYAEEDFLEQPAEYQLTRLCKLDQWGNVLERGSGPLDAQQRSAMEQQMPFGSPTPPVHGKARK